jgi:hypothetical protein
MINPEEYVNSIKINTNHYADQDFYENDILMIIEQAQQDAYNQGVYDSVNNATTKKVECFYDGVRCGGSYYIDIVDSTSILKLLMK